MNTFYAYVGLFLWGTWAIYWAISSTKVKSTERLEPVGSRALHVLPMLLAGALLLMPSYPPGHILFYRLIPATQGAHWGGCLLILLGLAFAVWARIHLGSNWSSRITVKEDHELIQSGPYAMVRHPIYTGLLLAIIGTALAIGEVRGLVAIVLMWVSFWRKLRVEERWMGEAFGERYEKYRRRTGALIPL